MSKTKNTEKEKIEIQAPVGIKNFKNSADVENFYRYVQENKLRSEALILMSTVLKAIAPPKKKRGRKKILQ